MKKSLKNIIDYTVIILVFALTGITTVYVSSFITNYLELEKWSLLYIVVYIFLIFPIYNVLLLGYALLFGRFNFFWGRIKKLVSKIF